MTRPCVLCLLDAWSTTHPTVQRAPLAAMGGAVVLSWCRRIGPDAVLAGLCPSHRQDHEVCKVRGDEHWAAAEAAWRRGQA